MNPLPGGQVLVHSLGLGLQPRQSIHLSQPQCVPFGSGDPGLMGLREGQTVTRGAMPESQADSQAVELIRNLWPY